MQQIPIQPIPSQIVSCVLGGQNVQIAIYYKTQGLFADVNSNGDDVVVAVLAHDGCPLVCIQYTGFVGNLAFIDTQGTDDPTYDGLGSRYQLVYYTEADLAAIVY
jgi:hypothetical protein